MALLEADVTSRPMKRAAQPIDHHVHIKNLHTKAEGVRHTSIEIQELIKTRFLHSESAKPMKFVSLKKIDQSAMDLASAVENPFPTLRSHKDIISVFIKYTKHINNSGEIQKISIDTLDQPQDSLNSVELKQLIHRITMALNILKVEIDDFLTTDIEEVDTNTSNQDSAATELSKTFLNLEKTLHNETVRALGVSSDIKEAMNHMCDFYKAYESALINKSG